VNHRSSRLVRSVLLVALSAAPTACGGGKTPGKHWQGPLVQRGRIAGLVVDAETGTPVAGAMVTAGAQRAQSRADGSFDLEVPPGRARVAVSSMDHVPYGREAAAGEVAAATQVRVLRRAPAQMVGPAGGMVSARSARLEFEPGTFTGEASVSATAIERVQLAVAAASAQFVDDDSVPRRVLTSVALVSSQEPTKPVRVQLPVPMDADMNNTALFKATDDGRWSSPVRPQSVQGGLATFAVGGVGQFGLAVDTRLADGKQTGFLLLDRAGELAPGQVVTSEGDLQAGAAPVTAIDPQGARVELGANARARIRPSTSTAGESGIVTAAGVSRIVLPKRPGAPGFTVTGRTATFKASGAAFSVVSCEVEGKPVDTIEVVDGKVDWTFGSSKGSIDAGQSATFCAGCTGDVPPVCPGAPAPSPDAGAPDAGADAAAPQAACAPPTKGPTMHTSTTLMADTVFTADGSPHILTAGLQFDKKLTIEPCAEVRVAAGRSIIVTGKGEIVAEGRAGAPIRIGPIEPDANWGTLGNYNGGRIRLVHTTLEKGGRDNYYAAMLLARQDPSMPMAPVLHVDNVVLRGSATVGLVLLDGATFTAESKDLQIVGSARAPLSAAIESLGTLPSGATFTGNMQQEVPLLMGLVARDTTLRDLGVPYVVGNLQIRPASQGATAPTVTLGPGVRLELTQNASITVQSNARLVAEGTADKPVTITARDPMNGWGYIDTYYGGKIRLVHTTLDNGGRASGSRAMIHVRDDHTSPVDVELLHVDTVTVKGSAGVGIIVDEGATFSADSKGLTITGSGEHPLTVPASILGRVPPGTYTGNKVDEIRAAGRVTGDLTIADRGVPFALSTTTIVTAPMGKAPTVTVGPGVTFVMLVGQSLNVQNGATLALEGLPDKPVRLTGRAGAGAWSQLQTYNAGRLRLVNAIVEGGGVGSGVQAMIEVKDDFNVPTPVPLIHVENLMVKDSGSLGLELEAGVLFSKESTGLTITGGMTAPLSVSAAALDSVPAGTYTGNKLDHIVVSDARVSEDATVRARGVPYLANRGLEVRGDVGKPIPLLTIEPGVSVKFPKDQGLAVGPYASANGLALGALSAVGTPDKPIVLTSAAEAPMPGDWQGLAFYYHNDARNKVEHVRVEYAGGRSLGSSGGCSYPMPMNTAAAAIIFYSAEATPMAFVRHTTIRKSAAHGIWRGWRGTPVDLLDTNVFEEVAMCHQSFPYPATGVCPDPVPCPK
jgi:catechol 2,3-dioxygenase-like lactoylglutathione lyase family enzyme